MRLLVAWAGARKHGVRRTSGACTEARAQPHVGGSMHIGNAISLLASSTLHIQHPDASAGPRSSHARACTLEEKAWKE